MLETVKQLNWLRDKNERQSHGALLLCNLPESSGTFMNASLAWVRLHHGSKLVDEFRKWKCKGVQTSKNQRQQKKMRSPGREGKLEHVLDARKLDI